MPASQPAGVTSGCLKPRLRIAVVIPVLNEAATLGDTLRGVVRQDYPTELLEVLIIDGGSTDNWRPALRELHGLPIECRVLDNPNRSTAAAEFLVVSHPPSHGDRVPAEPLDR